MRSLAFFAAAARPTSRWPADSKLADRSTTDAHSCAMPLVASSSARVLGGVVPGGAVHTPWSSFTLSNVTPYTPVSLTPGLWPFTSCSAAASLVMYSLMPCITAERMRPVTAYDGSAPGTLAVAAMPASLPATLSATLAARDAMATAATSERAR